MEADTIATLAGNGMLAGVLGYAVKTLWAKLDVKEKAHQIAIDKKDDEIRELNKNNLEVLRGIDAHLKGEAE